jgi:hypothetical protein
MILPLAAIGQKLRNAVGQSLLQAQLQLLTVIMGRRGRRDHQPAVRSLRDARSPALGRRTDRWLSMHKKMLVHRPPGRSQEGGVTIGSYERFRRDEDQQ